MAEKAVGGWAIRVVKESIRFVNVTGSTSACTCLISNMMTAMTTIRIILVSTGGPTSAGPRG